MRVILKKSVDRLIVTAKVMNTLVDFQRPQWLDDKKIDIRRGVIRDLPYIRLIIEEVRAGDEAKAWELIEKSRAWIDTEI